MKQHRTIELGADTAQDILDRLEHIILDMCTIKPYLDHEKRELALTVIERLDIVKAQLGEL